MNFKTGIKYFVFFLIAFLAGYFSNGNGNLKEFRYGLYKDDDVDERDRIALIDNGTESSAKTNCEAIRTWLKMAYPTATPAHCKKEK